MKKIIDNKQYTILWHADDLKTSHVDPAVISSVLADIDAEYGKIAKMTITRGKVHKYLGMTIDYSSPGKVIFSMINYIGKILRIYHIRIFWSIVSLVRWYPTGHVRYILRKPTFLSFNIFQTSSKNGHLCNSEAEDLLLNGHSCMCGLDS